MKKSRLLISMGLLMITLVVFAPFQSAYATTPSTSGLQLWWKMDEGSGSSVADYSGNSNTGTLVNGTVNAAWVAGHGGYGEGIAFSALDVSFGPGSPVVKDNPTGLDMHNKDFSVCAWFKTTSITGENEFFTFASNTGADGAGDYKLGISSFAGGAVIHFGSSWAGQGWVSSNPGYLRGDETGGNSYDYKDGLWHLACGTYKVVGGNVIQLYVDDVLLAYAPNGGEVGISTGTTYASSGAFHFSVGGVPDYTQYVVGSTVDEVMVYDRILTQTDVDNIYGYTNPTSTTTTTTSSTSTSSSSSSSTTTAPSTATTNTTIGGNYVRTVTVYNYTTIASSVFSNPVFWNNLLIFFFIIILPSMLALWVTKSLLGFVAADIIMSALGMAPPYYLLTWWIGLANIFWVIAVILMFPDNSQGGDML